MKTVQQLSDLKARMQTHIGNMTETLKKFTAESERVRADASRHPDYIREKIDEASKRAMDAFAGSMKSIREIAAMAKADEPFWSHTLLVLSRLKFAADDPVADSTIRLRYMAELTAMPASLL